MHYEPSRSVHNLDVARCRQCSQDDVNLRSIAAGEGIMALSGPAELPQEAQGVLA